MSHGPYPIDERDLRFALYDHLRAHELFELDAYSGSSKEEADMILAEGMRFARDKIWPTNAPSDREGCRFEAGQVTTPAPLKGLFKDYAEAGWMLMGAPPEVGGAGMPATISLALGEVLTGANLAFGPYVGLTRGVARLLWAFGNEWVKEHVVPKLFSGEWAGTMCLTEPSAGTALGDLQSRATPVDDKHPAGARYAMNGQKIFISGGEQDLTENIIHVVLAKTPDAPAGVKGISLFLVSKHKLEPDGSLSAKNDVVCTGIEHKMGLNGSATCALSFGDDGDCDAHLIGHESQGLEIMFHLMNEARIGTGLQGLCAATVSYLSARDYAHDRVQGVRMEELKDVDAERVAIIEHPDVKRMVFTMKAKVEGMRALLLRAAKYGDLTRHGPDDVVQNRSRALLEILTPLCKAHCSDVGFDVAVMAMQTYGGAGYTQEFPVEQAIRDVKVASIYEGANGIQALDLIGRKLRRNNGESFMLLMEEIGQVLERTEEHPALADAAQRLNEAVDEVRRATGTLAAAGMQGDLATPGLVASNYLTMLGNVVMGWLLLEQAEIAHDQLSALLLDHDVADAEGRQALLRSHEEAAFLDAKLHTARFFLKSVLCENRGLMDAVERGDREILDAVLRVD